MAVHSSKSWKME